MSELRVKQRLLCLTYSHDAYGKLCMSAQPHFNIEDTHLRSCDHCLLPELGLHVWPGYTLGLQIPACLGGLITVQTMIWAYHVGQG